MGRRTSRFIRGCDADYIIGAVVFAASQGHDLNLTITLYPALCSGRSGLSPQRLLARTQERLRHALQRRGFDLYWWWIREAKADVEHVHLGAHDPFGDAGVTFQRLLIAALAPDAQVGDGALLVKRTGSGKAGSGSIYGWVRYCLKGLDPREAAARGIKRSYQGMLTGKRIGLSQKSWPRRPPPLLVKAIPERHIVLKGPEAAKRALRAFGAGQNRADGRRQR
jgi:hypothetical protein